MVISANTIIDQIAELVMEQSWWIAFKTYSLASLDQIDNPIHIMDKAGSAPDWEAT